jgi:hypothetical protein
MRKLKRAIARYNMAREGIRHPNRKRWIAGGYTDSYFAQHWREYV